ncbi:GNAT family N-acetyltransferase [Natranaeroarchaeum sulfidigenes]|uniref:Acetyltransferase, RimL family n=1 Tax=Natranaeroarchaeum sulfidigenes TaxID=2784880 RepID=A0A897MWS6_9EURY|nr:GNAT family protein [Natranaeroarchaeum sulfidigenes]QSG02616.1 Acetyltransferase, RimL family [Natranaeroarchaeum sulfidigenes]
MPGPVFLEGEHVALRTIEEDDLEYLQEQINDPQVWRAIGRDRPVNAAQEQSFYEDVVCTEDNVTLMITDEDAVGTVGLNGIDTGNDRAELGYWVDPEHHRMGYGSDAASRIIEYGFQQLGLHRIEARVFEFNDASQALLESVGFVEEGVHRDAEFIDGVYQDVHWYGLLEGEWRKRR